MLIIGNSRSTQAQFMVWLQGSICVQQEESTILKLTGVMGGLIVRTNQMREIVQVRKHIRYCSKAFDTSLNHPLLGRLAWKIASKHCVYWHPRRVHLCDIETITPKFWDWKDYNIVIIIITWKLSRILDFGLLSVTDLNTVFLWQYTLPNVVNK